ncbi:MAG: glycosyltransferase family 2 protein [Chloroflexi bacterium]|nr:glycosyltransferase family 2 protein [Chloroflexota bacterium]
MNVSVIVPAFNAAATLAECLAALQTQTRAPDEIIVVDDGSTDRTAELARASGARVLQQPNRGPAAARNLGAQNARGDLILFTDADCAPSPDWIAQMIAPFADAQVIATKGTYRTRQRELIARLTQLEFEMRYERMARLARIDFVDSYAAAYRREIFLQAGGFDATFPVPSAEDVDLAFRLARRGCFMRFAPDAWVWHHHPTVLCMYLARKARYGWWRALLYLRYPEKIRGDAHTAPILKMQFALLALIALFSFGAWIWLPLAFGALASLLALVATTVPFARWAFPRDRAVALAWIPITLARVAVQGAGLGAGLVWHGLVTRRAR